MRDWRTGFERATLSLVHRALFGQQAPRTPRAILLYRSGRLGDFITAVPAMAAVRRQFPHARLILMTTDSTSAVMRAATRGYADAERLPWVDFVHPHLVDAVAQLPMERRSEALRAARAWLRRERPDLAFLLAYSGESWASKAKKLVFLRMAGLRGGIYGWRLGPGRREWRRGGPAAGHQVQAALDGIGEYGTAPASAARVEFPLTIAPQAGAWAEALWQARAWAGRPVVAVSPGASFSHKAWPLERYVEVCRQLASGRNFGFVVLGSSADQGLGEALTAALGDPCLNLAGRTDLAQLAALLRRCRLLLGNDGGAMHLAAAVGCACVTIMSGIEPAGIWEPYGQAAGAVRHPVACSPCFSFTTCPNGSRACVLEIAVDEVVQRCCAVLAEDGPRERAEVRWRHPGGSPGAV